MNVEPSISERLIQDRMSRIERQTERLLQLRDASNPTGDIAKLEQRIGIAIPADYKVFIARYGAVEIDGDTWVLDLRKDQNEFVSNQEKLLNLYNKRRLENDPICVLSSFPKLPGMLVFGGSYAGTIIGWLVNDGSSWPIVEYDAGANMLAVRKAHFLDWIVSILK